MKPDDMETRLVAGRLLRALRDLTPENLAAGRAWYPQARVTIRHLARQRGVDPDRLMYAAACLSPGLSWPATVETLTVLLDAALAEAPMPRKGVHATFGFRPHEKAWRILTTPVDAASLATGEKVSAFAANLMGDMDRVTVDRHIARLAGVVPRGKAAGPRAVNIPQPTRRQSEVIQWALRWVAETMFMKPAELQAALWSGSARS